MSGAMTRKQKRMAKIVADFQKYVASYDKQAFYTSYEDATFIHDMLYGIGLALDREQFGFADGYAKFRDALQQHLAKHY